MPLLVVIKLVVAMIRHEQVIPQFCFLYTELVVQTYLLIPLKVMANSYLTSQLLAALLPRYLHSTTIQQKDRRNLAICLGKFYTCFLIIFLLKPA